MFDTHCHLNFKAFSGKVSQVIEEAKKTGVKYFVVPGTDLETSKKAIEIEEKFDGVYAAVGIHPHHLFKLKAKSQKLKVEKELEEIEELLNQPKVVAVGEIGLDRYLYQKTKYKDYQVDEEFIELQKMFFIEQLKLAKKYKKAVIIHNRQARKDLLEILSSPNYELLITNYSFVFHCCESDDDLLDFAQKHKIFIGVDGDVTYDEKKQEFIKKVPLELLVLETDSPFLLPVIPSLTRSEKDRKKIINEPKNLPLIAEFVAKLKNVSVDKLIEKTTKNAKKLFDLK